jgi:hypothetical protein
MLGATTRQVAKRRFSTDAAYCESDARAHGAVGRGRLLKRADDRCPDGDHAPVFRLRSSDRSGSRLRDVISLGRMAL